MNLLLADLQREAAATGFPAEMLEKTLRLLSLLDALRSHPFLRSRVALKGGTALNLFVADVPRLSVDVDLNYVGGGDREQVLADRPKVEQAIQAVCGREGLAVKRVPGDHAGGKWRLTYPAASGRSGNLELDANFLLRTPLWPTIVADSRQVGSHQATQVPMLDVHELAAGKLAALVSRTASRDVFDTRELLGHHALDRAKLRLGFVVYGGANRKDWRSVSVDDVKLDAAEVHSQLLPTIRTAMLPASDQITAWGDQLVSDCRHLLSAVLPLTPDEHEFHRAAERSRRHRSRAPHRGFRHAGGVAGAPGLEVEGAEREEASWPSGGGGARLMKRLLLRVPPPLRSFGDSGPLLRPDPPDP